MKVLLQRLVSPLFALGLAMSPVAAYGACDHCDCECCDEGCDCDDCGECCDGGSCDMSNHC